MKGSFGSVLEEKEAQSTSFVKGGYCYGRSNEVKVIFVICHRFELKKNVYFF